MFRVLGEVATAKQPIAEGESFETESTGASFSEGVTHNNLGEHNKVEARELSRREGRELGCLLVQRTKGETQLQVTKWLSATNGWEAWRQLNASFHFKLLASLLHTSFDELPASCLQQLSVWKERVVLYKQLSGEQLSVSHACVCVKWTERARHFLLLHLDGDSSFSDLESLLAIYFNSLHAEQELSLNMIEARALREQGEENRANFQETCVQQEQQQEQSKQQKLAKGGQEQRKGKGKEKKTKAKAKESLPREKGKLTNPSLQPAKARGSQSSFQKVHQELAETSQKQQRKAKSQTQKELAETSQKHQNKTECTTKSQTTA